MTSDTVLSFKPSDEEYLYLEETGKLNKWSETVHNWIKKDRNHNIKQQVQNTLIGLILLAGAIFLYLSHLFLFTLGDSIFLLITYNLFTIILGTVGCLIIIWEAHYYA